MGFQIRDSFCAKIFLTLYNLYLPYARVTRQTAQQPLVSQTEILSGLVNADHIRKASRGGYTALDLAINLNERLHADLAYFISC